jgi:hypothetical protein
MLMSRVLHYDGHTQRREEEEAAVADTAQITTRFAFSQSLISSFTFPKINPFEFINKHSIQSGWLYCRLLSMQTLAAHATWAT